MKQQRAYHYRFYPTADQAAVLARTFGCVRWVYNWALRLRSDAYQQRQKRLSYGDLSTARFRTPSPDAPSTLPFTSGMDARLRPMRVALFGGMQRRAH
jgi:putative transposase